MTDRPFEDVVTPPMQWVCMALNRDGERCHEPAEKLIRIAEFGDGFQVCRRHVWEALDTPPRIESAYTSPACPFPSVFTPDVIAMIGVHRVDTGRWRVDAEYRW